MSTLAEDVANLLDYFSFGTVAVDIFYLQFPDNPVNCIAVLSDIGNSTIHSTSGSTIISILVRNSDITAGADIIKQIYTSLHDVRDLLALIPSASYQVIYSHCELLPRYIGKDANGKFVWSLDIKMNIVPN